MFNIISQGVIYDKDDEVYKDLAEFERDAREDYIREAGAYHSIIYLIFKLSVQILFVT